jgi:predicted dienelactone hydrolase
MKSIDVLLLAGIVTAAVWLILFPKRMNGILKSLIALTILLTFVQLFMEGYYWQYVPGYLLILVMGMLAIFLKESTGKLKIRLLRFTLLFMLLASIVPWAIFLPIPTLLKPQGNYPVGTRIFRWVDVDRWEQITSDPHDKRNVVVQAWYPTEENAKGTHSPYLDGMNQLPEQIGPLPRRLLDYYDQINTYGILNAPLSKAQNQWPIVIFLTGNVASRAFYTSLIAGLTSHGYVVLAIDHPYEAMITQLADGTIATTIENHSNKDPNLLNFMKGRLDTRIADITFVLNQLANPKAWPDPFLRALDLNRIVIAGHSLGGATAGAATASDSRLKAAVNIDGTLYGELPEPTGPRPFLLIESKKEQGERFRRYENGNQRFFKHFGGGYRYEITEADHYSFTDAPFLLAPPARFPVGAVLGFGNIPTTTHRATIDLLNAFFQGVLNNKSADLDSVANRYQGIIRKPID